MFIYYVLINQWYSSNLNCNNGHLVQKYGSSEKKHNKPMQTCFRQTSRYILNIAKRLISPNSNPPTPTHPSAFRRAQTEADAWSQHLVNYLALFILPEIKNLMNVSSTFGYNEHIRTAQNACEPTNIFLSV